MTPVPLPQGLPGGAPPRLDINERVRIILRYTDMVKHMAVRIAARLPAHIGSEDLFGAGIIGLMDALEKFNPLQGIPFEAYARTRVRGAILDEIRAMDWVPRSLRQKAHDIERAMTRLERALGRAPEDEEVAEALGVSLPEYFRLLDGVTGISVVPRELQEGICEEDETALAHPRSDEPFQRIHRQELRRELAEGIRGLPERERLVLSLYSEEELTMREIGEVLGCTESRVSQIHTKAVLKLRLRLGKRLRRDDLPDNVAVWRRELRPVRRHEGVAP